MSRAVAPGSTKVEPASIVMFAAPFSVTAGAVVSTTVIESVVEPALPAASVAEQLTEVVPTANSVPDAGVQFGVTWPDTVSDADDVKVTMAPPSVLPSTLAVGPVIETTGGARSATFT